MPLTTLFVDLNSYFASVEQQLRPELRGRPVAVVPVQTDTTSCIAASAEAKKFGVKTGTKVGDAKRLCPGLVCVLAQHTLYVRFHHQVLTAAETAIPVHAVHSIDEFSCRLLGAQRDRAEAERLAHAVKRAIIERVGPCLRCSIGIAPNRFLAKVASDMQKPDGLVILEPQDLPGKLLGLELIDLPGIGPRMRDRLHRRGVTSVEQLVQLPEARMVELWESVLGSWWYRALRGEDLREARTLRRSVGHQHVLPPANRNETDARAIALRLLDKAAARTRHLGYWARRLTVGVRYLPRGKWADSASFPECQDTMTMIEQLGRLWAARPPGTPLCVSVTLDELMGRDSATQPLFEAARERQNLSHAMDAINQRYGKTTIYPASMQQARKAAPPRIAFHSIPDLTLPDSDDGGADAVDDVG